MIGKAYLAGLCGFAGGIVGAWLLGQLGSPRPLLPAAAAATTPLEVVSARRIQLVDGAGRSRVEIAMSPDDGRKSSTFGQF
jgi:hypothetical protein